MDAKYKPVIGLEIHAELKTETKMFCSCKNDPNEKRPNQNICPICMGHPGTLPVANKKAIEKTIMAGLGFNCQIDKDTFFERKNYFYPDLPKGYQITQYQKPFCRDGYLELSGKRFRITRIHLEEDAGRLNHPAGTDYSLVDYNRAGMPLMELVTEPDFENGPEVKAFAEELQLILRYLNVSDADMEKGLMRVEVNISLTGDDGKWGTKVEIKNLNSIKAAADSVDFEIKRHWRENYSRNERLG
ncbi:MAG: Aspartyl/glutamyl-tRNA(Asn/Gln) amidotransferase subunit B [Candidatus Yanofskybacteria bacterium GW2011_GWD2_39_48]|uniref:Aspartyl/glutamyl-tRNA(Asn/Gln) amidotransferase subunit B n=1 Tax=Candidatus Yanofskybacteria bacterium GW2011_GWD2_39_48 TaxID=1619031 RepID=A0A0G0P6M5_9BACT|nr:MAG: Aspartyl/glutamyl-tRNA(Asn/Gln) amidotransferase subunit B [Candidatus Yanofskybacteria bacterium GW2011_GWD2_39_48]